MNISPNEPITIVAISGSLRLKSSNHAVLNVVRDIIGDRTNFVQFDGLADIPAFDDNPNPVGAVIDFRNLIRGADGVLICSPEYAFGVPGALKNAIDWTVSSGELVNKPLALITAATGGEKAHAAWLLIFSALSANIPNTSNLHLPYIRSKLDQNGHISNTQALNDIEKVVDSLIYTINHVRNEVG